MCRQIYGNDVGGLREVRADKEIDPHDVLAVGVTTAAEMDAVRRRHARLVEIGAPFRR